MKDKAAKLYRLRQRLAQLVRKVQQVFDDDLDLIVEDRRQRGGKIPTSRMTAEK
jgi:hypothetical protein